MLTCFFIVFISHWKSFVVNSIKLLLKPGEKSLAEGDSESLSLLKLSVMSWQ